MYEILSKKSGCLILLTLPLFIIIWLQIGCFEVPQEPVLPSWKVQLSIPLVDKTFYLKDAFKKNPNIVTEKPYFFYRPERFLFDSIEIGNKLKINNVI